MGGRCSTGLSCHRTLEPVSRGCVRGVVQQQLPGSCLSGAQRAWHVHPGGAEVQLGGGGGALHAHLQDQQVRLRGGAGCCSLAWGGLVHPQLRPGAEPGGEGA
jgi:hypothetical protein